MHPETPHPESAAAPENARRGAWRSFLFALKAIEIRLRFVAVLVGMGLVIGYWDTIKNHWDRWTRPDAEQVAALSGGEEFYCPMHPSVVRETPDPDGSTPKCPICGMPLSKRQKGAARELAPGVVGRVQLSPERIQMAGVRTVSVQRKPLVRDLRAVGYVAYDESKLSRIVTRFDGYVEKLYVNKTYDNVREGVPLGEIYSPTLYTAVQELLTASQNSRMQELASLSRQKLRLLGVDDREIDQIVADKKSDYRLTIRSPRSGHVIRKEVLEGDRIEAGQMLFEVADISTVWIEADIYEKDALLLRAGQEATAEVDALPERTFRGTIALIHAEVHPETRTLRVRFEIENSEHLLRPGMYATVHLQTPLVETEPFRSMLARQAARPRGDDPKGLAEWQQVCPVTGLKLGSMGEPVALEVKGTHVLLCCAGCKDRIQATPDEFLARLEPVSAAGVVAVPEQAVIDTGEQQVVYVERDLGVFEGVKVKLGPRADGYYPVIEGLLPGDRVAAAGAFLLDAETRLNPAAASAYFGASGGPKSGEPRAESREPDQEHDSERHRH